MNTNTSEKNYSDIYKHNCNWSACYDKVKNRYLSYICYTSREGQERYTFEIPKSVFDALDESKGYKNEHLIKENGRRISSFIDSIHGGPYGGTLTNFDDEGEEAYFSAYNNIMDELQKRFDEGDESVMNLWEVFAYRTKDKKKRSFYLVKAAESGIRNAEKELSSAYCYGREKYGIEANAEKALYWTELVAEKGTAEEQSYLGYCFSKGCSSLKKDPVKAAYWYTKAAERGDEEAQMQIGLAYVYGNGVEKNEEKAAYWFTKAAEQGSSGAQFNLGVFYTDGTGVEKSIEKAFYWYSKSAEQGYDVAQYNLGCFYYDGRAGEKKSRKSNRKSSLLVG